MVLLCDKVKKMEENINGILIGYDVYLKQVIF